MRLKIPLHPLQKEIAKDKTRWKVLACGRRWGKTRMCVAIALEHAVKGERVWWVAQTYQVAGIAWRQIKILIQQIPIPIEIKEADKVIIFPGSGGEIWFKSSDRADNLRGEGLNLIIQDEADFQPEEVWTNILRPALADRKGSAIFISTPNVEGGWFHRLFLRGQKGDDPQIKSWQFPSNTNPFLDPRELEAAKEELPSIVFRREFMAEFVSATGARVKREWLKYEDRAPLDLNIALGIDLAISEKATADYTAGAILGRDQEGNIHVLDVQRIRGSFSEQIKFIKQLAEKWKSVIVGIEDVAYQKALIQQVAAQTSLNVKGIKPISDKVSRFAPLEARYELGQVFHARDLPQAFEAELLSFPVAEHDDFVDALAYAWMALDEIVSPVGWGTSRLHGKRS